MKIIYPENAEKAYAVAAGIFADYWRRCCGEHINPEPVVPGALPADDLVLIGSDAVNPLTHELIKSRGISHFEVRYGSDDYHLLSLVKGNRNILTVAGGCGRAVIYAVYDFFRRRGQVEYFWDGDVFHFHGPLSIANLNIVERPHFKYRGLRYFAHRGAHRFFPEMWSLAEWQREIDWILKKRFNLFMLRIGTDDLFQRAFDLPYPPEDGADPDDPHLPHARTALWPLKFRGELRAAILAYARERGLVHPEDTGAMSHWYTPAPTAFFKKFPELPLLGGEKTPWYAEKHVAVWDIESDQAIDLYWRLTETHIREFGGGSPRLFHTIGLAERLYGETADENLQLKLFTLRRTQEQIRRFYPDVPLLIAGWDLAMWWKAADVNRLLGELDPENTIVFDYNADQGGRCTYREYGMINRFPWIFGMLHALAFNNEMRGNYRMLCERLREAAADEKCQGFLFWPELSHSDTFVLEFVAEKSWCPENLTEPELASDFCRRRYPVPRRDAWESAWLKALRLLSFVQWGEGEWPVSAFDLEFHHRLLESEQFCELTPERIAYYRKRCRELGPELARLPTLFTELARLLPDMYTTDAERRDLIDIARAVINLALRTMFMDYCVRLEAWRCERLEKNRLSPAENGIRRLFGTLADLLEQNDDFSLRLTLEKLRETCPLNPAAEEKLKENASSSYCRNQTCEVVRYLYLPELDAYFANMNAKIASDDHSEFTAFEKDARESGTVAGFCELPVAAVKKEIEDRFKAMPLAEMKFQRGPSLAALTDILETAKAYIADFLNLGEVQ